MPVTQDQSQLPDSSRPLSGRMILVTGASQGIGAEAATALGAAGATVVLLARNEMKLNAVYDKIETLGGPEPILAPLDLIKADDDNLYQLRGQLNQIQGALDGVIHCAAQVGPITPIANYNLNSWNEVMAINCTALFRLIHVLYPLLDAAKQAKVICFSDRIKKTHAFWGAYTASKAASDRLIHTWSEELDNTSSITCHSIYPGARRTQLRAAAYPAENPAAVPTTEALGAAFVELMTASNVDTQLDWSHLE